MARRLLTISIYFVVRAFKVHIHRKLSGKSELCEHKKPTVLAFPLGRLRWGGGGEGVERGREEKKKRANTWEKLSDWYDGNIGSELRVQIVINWYVNIPRSAKLKLEWCDRLRRFSATRGGDGALDFNLSRCFCSRVRAIFSAASELFSCSLCYSCIEVIFCEFQNLLVAFPQSR